MSEYKQYPTGTMVLIKSLGEQGEAFESAMGFISVWVGDEAACRYFEMDDVEFISEMMSMEDTELLEYYLAGFTDELDGIDPATFKDELTNQAYKLGRCHAIIGDDVRSVDYLSNAELLKLIKS